MLTYLDVPVPSSSHRISQHSHLLPIPNSNCQQYAKMVVEKEGTFEVNGHSLYTKSWLVRQSMPFPFDHHRVLHASRPYLSPIQTHL